mmetsp:Transcript_20638/g.57571  ORF Transcript_20638/g.57571 Transcript_20638/m.57571 type:complete len:363 (+) Transcript_20638:1234-2322(+)
MQVAGNQSQGLFAVILDVAQELPELRSVHEGLGFVGPLAFRQSLRELVGDDAIQHQIVEAVRKLLAHDEAEVHGNLRLRPVCGPCAQWSDGVILQVEHRRVLHEHLTNAVAVDMVIFHVLSREGLHPIDQGRLLDDVDRSIEVEAPGDGGLEVPEVQVRVCQAILRTGEHARIDELVAGDLPLVEHGLEVNPIEAVLAEGDLHDHRLDAVQQEAWRAENRRHDTLIHEMCQLGTRKIRRLQALVTLRPQVVEDEIDEVAIDATGRHSKALLCLRLLALRQVGPRKFHLLIQATDEHRVLRPWGDTLKHEERLDVVLAKGLELLVHETEDARRDAAECIREGVLQGLDGTQPEDRIHAHTDTL